jgi:hypothetical protein
LLKDISKWDLPTKLVISSCRVVTDNAPSWKESNNLGPKSWYALGQVDVQTRGSGAATGVAKVEDNK